MSDNSPDDASTSKASWRYPITLGLIFAVVLLAGNLIRRGQDQPAAEASVVDPTATPVVLTIETATEAAATDSPIGWSQGLTPLGVLQRHGTAVESTGSGSSAFITAILGIENEGDTGRNWQYWIDGERGNVSADAAMLQPGASLLWKFAEYE